MNKYLFIYHVPPMTGTPPAPEEMQAMLAQWGTWQQKFKDHVMDMGHGLLPGGKMLADGKVTDGPHSESKEVIGGYSLIQASSYDEALTVARECPITHAPNSRIEVRQTMGF